MFFVPRVNVIESDEGFSVEVLGQTGVRYTEGARAVFVDSEVLAVASSGLVIYESSIKQWDAPFSGDIDVVTRKAIVKNIRRAFSFRGLEIEVME